MKKFTLLLAMCMMLSAATFAQAGTLDSTFSRDGIDKTKPGSGRSVALQADGKIIVAGYVYEPNPHVTGFTLIRYKPNGKIDASFGDNGSVFTYLGGDINTANSVAIQADGKIVVAGTYSKLSVNDFALVRYQQNGIVDSSFGKNGKVFTDFGGSYDEAQSVAIQADGKIVVAGFTQSKSDSKADFALARYNRNGKLDSSFGILGRVMTDYSNNSNDLCRAVVLQTDGKIVTAGYTAITLYNSYYALFRYLPNGNLDTTFGGTGKIIDDVDLQYGSSAYSVAIQEDGRLVAAGGSTLNGFSLARYKQDGNLDKAFGTNGHVLIQIGAFSNRCKSVAIQTNGKIVMGGESVSYDSRDEFALTRIKSNGEIDSAFGKKGRVTTEFPGGAFGHSIVIQPDGKIVMAGSSGNARAIARYNGDNTSLVSAKNDLHNPSNLQKQNASSNLHLSPNPVKDILHIEGMLSSSKTISILDANGKLLRQIKTANTNYTFNLKQLSRAEYFIRIDEGEKTALLKFIKE
jgi:uncharacterized delta-60 repeat protein